METVGEEEEAAERAWGGSSDVRLDRDDVREERDAGERAESCGRCGREESAAAAAAEELECGGGQR